ncbi:MAG: cobalamin-dependent protein [Candidatus Pacebacteria bacterium]|nr:cobalamin-dependent protein [Candidatus Paceibacterota bacterium]
MTKNISCPLCGDSGVFSWKKKEKFEVLKCKKCDLGFVAPDFLPEDYRNQYLEDKSSRVEYYKSADDCDGWYFRRNLKKLEKFIKPGSILDIGCSVGTFLKEAQKKGWQAAGVEPNLKAAEIAQKYGKVYSDFFDENFGASGFSAVHMSDTIEHLSNPLAVLKTARGILSEKGILMVTTCDMDSFLGKAYQIKPREHLFYFNKKSLRRILEQSGFKVLLLERITRKRSFSGLEKSTTEIGLIGKFFTKFRFFHRPMSFLSGLLFYDEILAIAEKSKQTGLKDCGIGAKKQHNFSKMDILLIYPPISVNERYSSNVGKAGGNLAPLGIANVAAYLREKGFNTGIIDAVAENYTINDLAKKILEINPRVVGISALTSNFFRAVAVAKEIKKILPDALVIIGGHHAAIMPLEIMRENECFDILVKGEGELTAKEVMEEYKKFGWNREDFLKKCGQIKGIYFKSGDEVIFTGDRDMIENLDALPFPARDLLPMDKYLPLPNQYKRAPVANMVAIRGCVFNCTFCSSASMFGRKIRLMSPERTVNEIEYLIKEYGVKEISFWDDAITVSREWMMKFCDLILEKGIDITWTCYSRVNTVDEELLRKMKNAGCWNIFFGFESGDQKLLDNIDKRITLEQIEKANDLCKKVGIEVRASFMLALPGETPELGQKTIDFAKKLNPDYAQFSVTTPYPGTRLYDEAEKYGTLTKNFSEYHGWSPVFVPFGYKNREEIEKIEKRAMRQFYMRPAYIWGRIKKIDSFEDIKRYMKGLTFVLGFIKGKK